MKHIQLTICLNDLKSHMNSTVPSYSGETLYHFNNSIDDTFASVNNYGYYPIDLDLCKIDNSFFGLEDDESIPIIEKLKHENADTNVDEFIVSFNTLKEWYHFFEMYEDMLNVKLGNCFHKCNSIKEANNYVDEDYNEIYDDIYVYLGGEHMYNFLKQYIFPPIGTSVDDLFGDWKSNDYSTYIQIPILITNKIDDLGAMTEFAEEWTGLMDYSANEETNGTVVSFNDQDWIHNENKGYIWSDKYKEAYFGNYNALTEEEQEWAKEDNEDVDNRSDFTRYFDKYLCSNLGEFESAQNGKFAFKNDKIIWNPTPRTMADAYDYVENLCLVENNILYSSTTIEYIIYDTKSKSIHELSTSNANQKGAKNVYKVERDAFSNPYVIINNIVYTAEFDETDFKFHFIFKDCGKDGEIDIKTGLCIFYHDLCFKVDEDAKKLIINDSYDHKLYTAYAYDGHKYVGFNDGTISNFLLDKIEDIDKLDDENENSLQGYVIDEGNKVLYVCFPYQIYDSEWVTGYTDSKLSLFADKTYLVDDMGNKIEGSFNVNEEYSLSLEDTGYTRPTEDERIDIPYHVGAMSIHTSNITDDIIWCDFLKSIKVYRKDESIGYEVSSAVTTRNIFDYVDEVIREDENEDNNVQCADKTIYIDFEYYIGAICKVDSETNEINIVEEEGDIGTRYTQGIKCVETCILESGYTTYHTSESEGYQIKIFDIKRDIATVKNTHYNVQYGVPQTRFEVYRGAVCPNVDEECNADKNTKGAYYAYDNGFNAFPTLRREHEIGNSMRENINNNIYIERGIHVIMDKQMKLLEIKSLKALEKYGNGAFNLKSK